MVDTISVSLVLPLLLGSPEGIVWCFHIDCHSNSTGEENQSYGTLEWSDYDQKHCAPFLSFCSLSICRKYIYCAAHGELNTSQLWALPPETTDTILELLLTNSR